MPRYYRSLWYAAVHAMRLTRAQLFFVAGALVVAGGVGGWRLRVRASGPPANARELPITFGENVAPLVFAKCAPCHHEGGAGPFPLTTYDEVSAKATDIADVTGRRFMPPWRAARGVAEYANERGLADAEIDLVARWVRAGAPRGDPAKEPKRPEFPDGWQLGKPDVVVDLPDEYVLAAEGTDVYRNFVVPNVVTRAHFVAAWEFRAGSRAIHHAILNVDRAGLARARDVADPAPGFGGMDVGDVQSADGFYLVWTPGKVPTPPDPAMGWRIDEHTDLVLQLHMQPTGKPERVRPKIALYFSPRPPTIPRFTLRVGDPPIDIPAGARDHAVHEELTLPTDVFVVSLFPHAHFLARRLETNATLPDGTTRRLLRIDDWDFAWQDEYTFATPVQLPAGTTLAVDIHYDNSAENPRNPSRPPKRVTLGEKSTDEMGNVTYQVVPVAPDGIHRLREQKYRREVLGARTARSHYNLANALADLGRTDEAIEHYRAALKESPQLGPAHFNLGNLLLKKNDLDGAIAEYRAALAVKKDDVAARINLGHALEKKGQSAAAITEFRAAIAIAPTSALAESSLAAALAAAGARDEAIQHFQRALVLDPNDARARADLAALNAPAGSSNPPPAPPPR